MKYKLLKMLLFCQIHFEIHLENWLFVYVEFVKFCRLEI